MTVDCQWIEKNLEALYCGTLTAEETRTANAHIESCGACAKELAALDAIDPIVKRHFQRELDRAARATATRRAVPRRGLAAAASALILAASVLLVVQLRTQHPTPAVPANAATQEVTPSPVIEPAPPVKSTDETTVGRAKPIESTAGDRIEPPAAAPASDNNAPEFLVSDPAGYSRTLADYRGRILVIAVLNSRQPEAISNFERLYEMFAINSKLRFLGVSNDRRPRPANTTFPLAYNQGSRLFGAESGSFLLLNESGSIQLRGSLVTDFEALRKKLATD